MDLNDAAQLIAQAIAAMEKAEADRVRNYDAEKRAFTAKLQSAKDHAQRLKQVLSEKAALQAEVSRQASILQEAEDHASLLRDRLWEQNQEMSRLREQLKRAERAPKSAATPFVKQDQVVKRLAELECFPLRHCNGDTR